MTAHGLGELTALVVAHISRRATDKLGDLELATVLRHIKADERILAAKQILGKRLCKLGLTGTRGAQEDERAAGTARIFEGRATATNSLGHSRNRLVLADNARLKHALALQQAARFALGERAHRHAGGDGDDIGNLSGIDDKRIGIHLSVPSRTSLAKGNLSCLLVLLELGGTIHIVIVRGGLYGIGKLGHALLGIAHFLRGAVGGNASTGTGFVDKVDGFIGQVAVLDIAVGQARRSLDGSRRIAHVMVLLVARHQCL